MYGLWPQLTNPVIGNTRCGSISRSQASNMEASSSGNRSVSLWCMGHPRASVAHSHGGSARTRGERAAAMAALVACSSRNGPACGSSQRSCVRDAPCALFGSLDSFSIPGLPRPSLAQRCQYSFARVAVRKSSSLPLRFDHKATRTPDGPIAISLGNRSASQGNTAVNPWPA